MNDSEHVKIGSLEDPFFHLSGRRSMLTACKMRPIDGSAALVLATKPITITVTSSTDIGKLEANGYFDK